MKTAVPLIVEFLVPPTWERKQRLSVEGRGVRRWGQGLRGSGSLIWRSSVKAKGRTAALRTFEPPTPKPPVSTLTPWATANSKFPELIIDEDEEAKGHGDQPPLEPENTGEMTR